MLDPPATGAWNMSVDQALLESVESSGVPVLRIYAWEPATLSLGYFQSYSDREQHAESRQCPVVRRASGGGAIMHHLETTYSLCIPSTNRWSARNTDVYSTVHDCIVETLLDWDVGVTAYEESKGALAVAGGNPFLCFLRRSSGDLIFGSDKVVGSAQRRSKRALLQHGSILWERSEFAPELPGINDLAQQCVDDIQFVESFVGSLSRALKLSMQRQELTDTEREMSQEIVKTKFGTESWSKSRHRTRA